MEFQRGCTLTRTSMFVLLFWWKNIWFVVPAMYDRVFSEDKMSICCKGRYGWKKEPFSKSHSGRPMNRSKLSLSPFDNSFASVVLSDPRNLSSSGSPASCRDLSSPSMRLSVNFQLEHPLINESYQAPMILRNIETCTIFLPGIRRKVSSSNVVSCNYKSSPFQHGAYSRF